MISENLEFRFADPGPRIRSDSHLALEKQLFSFRQFGRDTRCIMTEATNPDGRPIGVKTFVNEFWTSKQRAAHSLHEVSYRACFKPQLPRFFIERLTAPGDVVYDPFMGRGTTLIEAGLLGRVPFGCDINPVSSLLARPRLRPPALEAIAERLREIPLTAAGDLPDDLLVFYHPKTLLQVCALREYLLARRHAGEADQLDDWITMVALNRLTGHSPGFFSVYTLPPNQAVSVQSQRKINKDRNQTPEAKDVRAIILKKSRLLLSDCTSDVCNTLAGSARRALIVTGRSAKTPQIGDATVTLAVTSPPFLDVVDYVTDNWLRCWFAGIDASTVKVTTPKKLPDWQAAMTEVFHELFRVIKPGGHVAFEVGEVKAGRVRLEETVVPCGIDAGFEPLLIVINDQKFTKTANCWGVDNNAKGTNTNRIVVFRKPR